MSNALQGSGDGSGYQRERKASSGVGKILEGTTISLSVKCRERGRPLSRAVLSFDTKINATRPHDLQDL